MVRGRAAAGSADMVLAGGAGAPLREDRLGVEHRPHSVRVREVRPVRLGHAAHAPDPCGKRDDSRPRLRLHSGDTRTRHWKGKGKLSEDAAREGYHNSCDLIAVIGPRADERAWLLCYDVLSCESCYDTRVVICCVTIWYGAFTYIYVLLC